MEEETYLICSRCKKKVIIPDIRADKTGKGWICLECYRHQHPDKETAAELISGADISTIPDSKSSFLDRMKEKGNKLNEGIAKKYMCDSCGYRFTRDSDFIGKGCPFCGRTTGIQESR